MHKDNKEEQYQSFEIGEWWHDNIWRPNNGDESHSYEILDMHELEQVLQEA